MFCIKPLTVALLACVVQSVGHAAPTVSGSPLPQQAKSAPVSAVEDAYQRALKALVAGKLEAAQQAFEQALKADPKLAKAMLGLAEVAFKQGKLPVATQWIERAVQAEPRSSEAQASLGRSLALQGKIKEAEGAFSKAMELIHAPHVLRWTWRICCTPAVTCPAP